MTSWGLNYVHNYTCQFIWMWTSHKWGKHLPLDHTERSRLKILLKNVQRWNFNQFVFQKETTPNVLCKKTKSPACIIIHKKWKSGAFTSYSWLTSLSLTSEANEIAVCWCLSTHKDLCIIKINLKYMKH